MADQLQLRGGTTNEHSTFTGALREVTVDTDKDTLIVHDAATAGGHPLLREDGSNSALSLGTAGTPSIKFTGDTNTGLYSPGADQVAISTGGSARLYVAADGDVGVGTTTVNAKLEISGNSGGRGVRLSDGEVLDISAGGSANDPARFATSSGSGIAFAVNGTSGENLRIDSSGRVGIGTSSPSVPLQVRATQAEIKLTSDAGGYSQLQFGDTADEVRGSIVYSATDDKLFIRGYNNENAITVDSSERVGVGTTSPSYKLHVNGGQVRIEETAASSDGVLWLKGSTTSNGGAISGVNSSDGAGPLKFYNGTTEAVRIDSSGRVGVGTSSPSNTLHVNSGTTNNVATFESTDTGAVINITDSVGSSSIETNDTQLKISVDPSNAVAGSNLRLQVDGSTKLLINDSGNVGVGTTSPDGLLHIASTSGLASSVISTTAGSDAEIEFRNTSGGNSTWAAGLDFSNSKSFNLAHAAAEGASLSTDSLLTVTTGGNVGIGTSVPDSLLEVRDSLATGIISRASNTQGTNTNKALKVRNNSDTDTFAVSYRGQGYFADSVGIGTTAPSGRLHVIADAITTGAGLQTWGYDVNHSNYQLRLRTDVSAGVVKYNFNLLNNGTEYDNNLVLDRGNIGIGTASPTYKLHVTGGNSAFFVGDANGNGVSGGWSSGAGGAFIQGYDTVAAAYEPLLVIGNHLEFRSGSTGAERARIDGSGNFGVNASSPSTFGRFVVRSDDGRYIAVSSGGVLTARYDDNSSQVYPITIRNTGMTTVGHGAYLRFQLGRSTTERNAGLIGAISESDYLSDANADASLTFQTTQNNVNTERMRIGSNGQLHSFSSANTSFYLQTANSSSSTQFLLQGTHSTTSLGVGGTSSITIANNGDVKNTNNSYGAISDIKLKENIVDASSQWNDLKAIQVRNYNFKEETGQQTHTQIGVVAQEVELVSPGLVTEAPDIDEDGNDLGTVTKSVNYSVLYMKAVKALQEAMERIETLEAKVAALEAN